MSVRNCHSGDDQSAVILLTNTQLTLVNSEFANNGLLFHHSQLSDNCSLVSITVTGCVFNNDLDSRPLYQPGLKLAGCDLLRLSVTNSRFQTAPIIVKAQLHSDVSLFNVLLSGVSVRGSSLDLNLGKSHSKHVGDWL